MSSRCFFPSSSSFLKSLLLIVATLSIIATSQPICSQTCGQIFVPSPLSSLPGCGHSKLQLQCNYQQHLFLHASTESFRILNITATTMVIDVTSLKATSCNGSEVTTTLTFDPDSPYLLSGNNEFFLTGCDAAGNYSSDVSTTASSCNTGCHKPNVTNVRYPFCTLSDCCVTTIPAGARRILFTSSAPGSCSFSSIVFPKSFSPNDSSYGIELLWGVPGSRCSSVNDRDLCSTGSQCVNSTYVPGYNCVCNDGFTGDGYRNGSGCSAIDHCDTAKCAPKAHCINEAGSYRCKCAAGYGGDGTLAGGCTLEKYVILIPVLGVPAVLVLGFCLWKYKPKSLSAPGRSKSLRHFEDALKENNSRLFTWAEMERATKRFREENRLGNGSFGTVYKGTLDDNTVVAIKKANNNNAPRVQQFVNEVSILSKVHHRNLVKLLGCCIERDVPLLVYEFVPKGTLFEHLHQRGDLLSWNLRLRIAMETAEALTYLHTAAMPPIYHRDVKSSNILLDDKLTAKVADFGISKLVPVDCTHISTTLHGTPGYIDPQYQQSYQLTDKSDVYSFGVVILELITGQMPVDFSRNAADKNLSTFAMSFIQKGAISDLIDKKMDTGAPEIIESVVTVANLAAKRLEVNGSQRPNMRYVLNELKNAMQLIT